MVQFPILCETQYNEVYERVSPISAPVQLSMLPIRPSTTADFTIH